MKYLVEFGGKTFRPARHQKFRGEFRGKFRQNFRKLRFKFRVFFLETSFSRRAVLIHSPKPTLLRNRPFVSSRTKDNLLSGKNCSDSNFQELHSLTDGNQVSLVRTHFSHNQNQMENRQTLGVGLRSQPPFTGVPRASGRKLSAFGHLARSAPKSAFLSAFERIFTPKVPKSTQKALFGALRAMCPKALTKHSVGHFPARGPGHSCKWRLGSQWSGSNRDPDDTKLQQMNGSGMYSKLHANLVFQAWISFLKCFRATGTPIKKILVYIGMLPCLVP